MPERWALVLVVTILGSIPGRTGPPEGRVVPRSELPYVCSVRLRAMHRCSATILNPSWLLTSGHCIAGIRATVDGLSIVCGVHMYRAVAEVVPHPGYDDSNYPTGIDLALVMTQKPLNFTGNVQPIPLFDGMEIPKAADGKSIRVGFKRLDVFRALPFNPSLQVSEVAILSSCECQLRLGPSLAPFLSDSTICTDNSPSTCVGNAGTPLMIATDLQPYNLLAVFSWTVAPCGTGPAMYVRVASHLGWILDVIAVN